MYKKLRIVVSLLLCLYACKPRATESDVKFTEDGNGKFDPAAMDSRSFCFNVVNQHHRGIAAFGSNHAVTVVHNKPDNGIHKANANWEHNGDLSRMRFLPPTSPLGQLGWLRWVGQSKTFAARIPEANARGMWHFVHLPSARMKKDPVTPQIQSTNSPDAFMYRVFCMANMGDPDSAAVIYFMNDKILHKNITRPGTSMFRLIPLRDKGGEQIIGTWTFDGNVMTLDFGNKQKAPLVLDWSKVNAVEGTLIRVANESGNYSLDSAVIGR